jgi:hypothetical protein
MGCNLSKTEDSERNDLVEKYLKKGKEDFNNEIKLLLLGTNFESFL